MQTGSRGIRLLNIIPTRDDVPRPAWERDSASAGICLKGHVVYLIMAPLIVYSYISISICRFILIFISITVISNTAAISFAVITVCFIAIVAYITISHIYVIIITAIVSSMRTRRLNSASFITLAFRVVRIFEANHPRAFSMEPERISPENGVPGNFRDATTHL